MSVNYDALVACSASDEPRSYSDTDAMLYALAAGFGQNPDEHRERDYVYEGRALKTVPSMGTGLLSLAFLENCGWDARRVSRVRQDLQLYRPLPGSADLRADRRVVAVFDHGRNSGVSIVIESEVRMAKDDTVLFTLGETLLAMGDGGFGGPTGHPPPPHKLPSREADLVCELPSRSDQALLFRLIGDRDPLHGDVALARSLGFDTTPLPEQCVAAMACRAVLRTICEYDFTLIASFELSFVTPLYPGESMKIEMWQDRNVVSFRCVSSAREAVIADHGKCTLVA